MTEEGKRFDCDTCGAKGLTRDQVFEHPCPGRTTTVVRPAQGTEAGATITRSNGKTYKVLEVAPDTFQDEPAERLTLQEVAS